MIKGFIDILDTAGVRHLINIRHIEEIVEGEEGGGSWIYLAHNNPDAIEQDNVRVNESITDLKEYIMEAVGDGDA